MVAISLELKLPEEKVKLLNELARARHTEINDVLTAIVSEWLEREAKLRRARQTLAQFSQGVGSSQLPSNAARQHDTYLYGKP